MAATLLSGGGGGKEGGLWEGTGADQNGVNPEANRGEPSTPSSADGVTAAPETPPGFGVASAGESTTCHLCTSPRVSRTVTCQGCHKTFHWICVGFYEHKYHKPGPDWRCKECKVVETSPPAATGIGQKASPAAPAVEEVQSPASGELIDVGEDAPPPTTLPATTTLGATVPARPGGSLTAVLAMPAAVGPADGAASVPTGTPVEVAAPAVTVPSPICPFCGNELGRKRTMDCSVCNTPWHASCVNVRGAVTPKSWVCRDCKPAVPAAAPVTSPTSAAATSPPVAAEAVSGGCWARDIAVHHYRILVNISGTILSSSKRAQTQPRAGIKLCEVAGRSVKFASFLSRSIGCRDDLGRAKVFARAPFIHPIYGQRVCFDEVIGHPNKRAVLGGWLFVFGIAIAPLRSSISTSEIFSHCRVALLSTPPPPPLLPSTASPWPGAPVSALGLAGPAYPPEATRPPDTVIDISCCVLGSLGLPS